MEGCDGSGSEGEDEAEGFEKDAGSMAKNEFGAGNVVTGLADSKQRCWTGRCGSAAPRPRVFSLEPTQDEAQRCPQADCLLAGGGQVPM